MPDQTWICGLPGWLSLGYITMQLWLLLDSALRVRPTGMIGAVLAIAPVMTGIVMRRAVDDRLPDLSVFQLNALAHADHDRHRGVRQHPMGAQRGPAARRLGAADTDRSDRGSGRQRGRAARPATRAISRICVTGCGRSKPGTLS